MDFRKSGVNWALVLLAWLWGSEIPSASAQEEAQRTSVYFGNGMFTDIWEARLGVDELRMRLNAAGIDGRPGAGSGVDFYVAYNQDEAPLRQLLEVFRQKTAATASNFWRWISRFDLAPEWFRESAEQIATSYSSVEHVIDEDLAKHVQWYRGDILSGRKVVVVAHSQGNFYANFAHDEIYGGVDGLRTYSFGIVSVANPDARVAGGGPYTTLESDIIINAVRLASGTALAATPGATNSRLSSDPLGHAFIGAYLGGDVSGPRIVGHTLEMIDALEWPDQIAQAGIITVTLEWGEEPDVDLHVFEPTHDGEHVYWAYRLGTYGYLDVDDVTSFGPEHYYVSRGGLGFGTYRIAVNYYEGDSAELARIQIRAGGQVRTYSVLLPESRGSSGDFDPMMVAEIEVSPHPLTGAPEFMIRGL